MFHREHFHKRRVRRVSRVSWVFPCLAHCVASLPCFCACGVVLLSLGPPWCALLCPLVGPVPSLPAPVLRSFRGPFLWLVKFFAKFFCPQPLLFFGCGFRRCFSVPSFGNRCLAESAKITPFRFSKFSPSIFDFFGGSQFEVSTNFAELRSVAFSDRLPGLFFWVSVWV